MSAILVVDDSLTVRMDLIDALDDAGFRSVGCANLAEAREALRMHAIALAILDVRLPDGDGVAFVEELRAVPRYADLPILMLSSEAEVKDRIRGLRTGATDYLGKPYDTAAMIDRILNAVLGAARAEPGEPVGLLSPKRILAVDDCVTYLHALADQLRDEGYDVAQATSGEEAIDLLAVQQVDCILLDRLMPGLSGAETCQRIKAAPTVRDIPLIMLTSLDGRDAMIDGFSAGADDFISKSSGLDVLKARVRAQIRRKQFEDEHRSVREQLLRSEREASEARAVRELAETRAALVEQLEQANRELTAANRELAAANREFEAFSYSVSHDLRAPLRSIDAFTRALAEDAADRLDGTDRGHVERVLAATGQMSELIDALLGLSRISRAALARSTVDLSGIALAVFEELRRREPAREVELAVAPRLHAHADGKLLRIVFDNVLGNAWKFTSRRDGARIEVGAIAERGERVFFVRDNGAGFAAADATRLFAPFQRLHSEAEFKGTGIGLATVHRIVERHGGRIWAEGVPGTGATFYFTLP